MTYISLSWTDLAVGSILLVLAGGLSILLKLGIARSMAIAAVRMVVQLSLVGLVLKTLFETVSPWLTAAVAIVMLGFAGREVVARQTRKFSGFWTYGIGGSAMLIAGTLVTVLALTTQLQPDPWYHPRWAIPLLGMMLGNAMTAVSISLDRFLSSAVRERVAIEAQLALGASRTVAFRPIIRAAMRAALIGIINAMAACGLVSIPGMMTGQILAGAAPGEAAKYQILIMVLLAGTNALGALIAVYGAAARLSDDRHRVRLDRLSASA